MTHARQWSAVPSDQYVGLYPWVWIEFQCAEPPGPFPFLGGVDPHVVASLWEVHQHLSGAIDIAISDVFAGRASPRDPLLQTRLENAYAEVVHSRPHFQQRIRCGRSPEGEFHWDYPLDPEKSAVLRYNGLRICNAATGEAIPLGFDYPTASAVGKMIGWLDGTHTAGQICATIEKMGWVDGRQHVRVLTELLDLLPTHDCLALSTQSSIRSQWLNSTLDGDMVHLGHAGLMYRQNAHFLLFDPWLMPWFAEAPVPSLWGSLLPKPAAIFLTHDHDDHVDPRTLLAFPKDVPVIVPSRKNRRKLFYDYRALLGGLGFDHVIELAHGETWPFDGGGVISVPFYGESSCDVDLPRNCYLITDRGRNLLIHVDSGPTNTGDNAVKDGVIDELVRRYGPIETVYAQPGQLLELRTFAAYACLSPPGRWLEVGENCCVSTEYLTQLVASAKARLFVAYANGGADWLPDHPVFVFSRRNQALREMVTAYWWPLDSLQEMLAAHGCRFHHSRALAIFGDTVGRNRGVLQAAAPQPMALYRLDHGDPPFMSKRQEPGS